MQKLIALLILSGSILRTDPVLVTKVTDGDSLTVQSLGGVRLLGIEASSAKAKERLEALVLRRWVRLEYDDDANARTSKHRAYVVLDTSECVNLTMVREGLARVVPRGEFSRRAEFERAQDDAQRFRRGMWAGYTRGTP